MKTFIYSISIIFLGICVIFIMSGGISKQKPYMEKENKNEFIKMTDSIISYKDTLKKIAIEIEEIKSQYPQLKDFQSVKNVDLKNLHIVYEYKTHKPNQISGWSSGVPAPDEDGIWFYINFRAPDSLSQIDTQPVTPCHLCIGKKRVTFLLLEGKKTKSIFQDLFNILKKHGVIEC